VIYFYSFLWKCFPYIYTLFSPSVCFPFCARLAQLFACGPRSSANKEDISASSNESQGPKAVQ